MAVTPDDVRGIADRVADRPVQVFDRGDHLRHRGTEVAWVQLHLGDVVEAVGIADPDLDRDVGRRRVSRNSDCRNADRR